MKRSVFQIRVADGEARHGVIQAVSLAEDEILLADLPCGLGAVFDEHELFHFLGADIEDGELRRGGDDALHRADAAIDRALAHVDVVDQVGVLAVQIPCAAGVDIGVGHVVDRVGDDGIGLALVGGADDDIVVA